MIRALVHISWSLEIYKDALMPLDPAFFSATATATATQISLSSPRS